MTTDLTPQRETRTAVTVLHRHLVVSERIRMRRLELGLTQKEVVARLRHLGLATTNKALSSLEHGTGLDVCKLPEVARALQCTLTYLMGLTDDPARWEPDGQVGSRRPHLSVPAADGPLAHTRGTGQAARPPSEVGQCGEAPRILGPLDVPGGRRA